MLSVGGQHRRALRVPGRRVSLDRVQWAERGGQVVAMAVKQRQLDALALPEVAARS
jgi:hypothetical protein